MCLPTFHTTHSNIFTIDHNRQSYTVRDGASFVLTQCPHHKLFLWPQFVQHRKHGLSHHNQSQLDIIMHLRPSSCQVRYFCLISAKTGINRRTLVKSRNMKLHANSKGGSGTIPCWQTDETNSRFLQLLYERIQQISARMAGLRANISTRDPPNTRNNGSTTTLHAEKREGLLTLR
jgi:hypothetical protein